VASELERHLSAASGEINTEIEALLMELQSLHHASTASAAVRPDNDDRV
jgi:hypothetical protein